MQAQTHTRTSNAPGEALFLPLGYSRHKAEIWIHLRVRGEVRTFRPSQALGLGFLLGVYPDHDHWARLYPSATYHGRKVNWQRACADITRMCIEAGEIVQP